jgi:hypothetical protein
VAHRVLDGRRGAQPARRRLGGDDVAEILLDDGRAPGVDQVDLGALRVDADDFMAFLRKQSRGYGADLSEPQHADFHERKDARRSFAGPPASRPDA